MTRALTDQVGGGPKLELAAVPRSSVVAESLAPPPGVGLSNRGRSVPIVATSVAASAPTLLVPDRLPDQVSQASPAPGSIFLRASEFGRIDYANRVAAQLTGLNPIVEHVHDGRSTRYRVRAGPFPTVAAADAALDQARRAGVIDSHLVVE